MQSSILALRALGAVVLRRILRPALILIVLVLTLCFAATLVLASLVSLWWLLLLIIFVPVSFVVGIVFLLLWQATNRLIPRALSRQEHRQLWAFCTKILVVAERAKLPYPVLVVLIGKDILRRRESVFLEEVIGDSKSLTTEFGEIRKMFT